MFFKFSLHHYRIALLLLFSDCLGLLISFSVVYALHGISRPFQENIIGLAVVVTVALFGLYLAETYEIHTQVLGLRSPYRVILSNLISFFVILLCSYFYRQYWIELIYIRILFLGLAVFTAWASFSRFWLAKLAFNQASQSTWLIMEKQIFYLTTWYDLMRAVQTHSMVTNSDEADIVRLLENATQMKDISLNSYSGVLIGRGEHLEREAVQSLMQLRLEGTLVYSISEFCESFIYKIPPIYVKNDWFVFSAGFSLLHSYTRTKLKRVLDIVISIILLLLTSPLMMLIGLLIKLDSRGPIFYSQIRSGMNKRTFRLYKFRSMFYNAESGQAQWAKSNDPRVTRVGRFLRLTRIDELPQIFNVLAGDMSVIGPRPERPEFDQRLSLEIPYYDIRYLVKPGITGWAQVMYPYGASIEDAYQKLAFDLYYIKNYSLLLDIAIIFKTIRVILLGRGR